MNDMPLKLEECTATDLDVFVNPSDLRQDIHAFVEYARLHEIKRGHRDNLIPKAHQQRLARAMSDPASAGKMDEDGHSNWIDHVNRVCLGLKVVSYDTKGEYAGYSSAEPTFPDNYIEVEEKAYKKFLELSLPAQEQALLAFHVEGTAEDRTGSEFFRQGTLSRSDPFDGFGCATGVAPTIPYAKVRRQLLELLARCPTGIWLRTASLVEFLKANDPWFLIPKVLPAEVVRSGRGAHSRYDNFVERKRGDWGNRDPISSKDPEGFAKVEGRYIERFLEGIPLVLGYADVAYLKRSRESAIVPDRGLVAAFRVTEKLRRAIRNEIAPPKITVLPNFEAHVESLFFPAQTEARLRPWSELVQRGIVTVFKLTKAKVAATSAAEPKEGAIDTLEALSGQPLPGNVRQELNDWAEHSEKVILYTGFGLLEGPRETAAANAFVVETVSPKLALVRAAEKLYRQLEAAEQVPIRIRHAEGALAAPAHVKSCLAPAAARPPRASGKTTIKLKRSIQTTLWFADAEAHAAFSRILLDAKCVVPTDRRALTVSYPRKTEPLVKECLKKFTQEFAVEVEDIET